MASTITFRKLLLDNLDDLQSREEVPEAVRELQAKLPNVNKQIIELVLAASSAIIDTINKDNKK